MLRKSNPLRPAADSLLQLLSLYHGEGKADRDVKWFVVGGLVQLNIGEVNDVHVVLEIYVRATAISN